LSHFSASLIQPKAWSILARSFERNRVASTYLFHGPEGLGHWPLAISFTALLNCLEPVTDKSTELKEPCGTCRHCKAVFALNFEGLQIAVPVRSHKNHDEMIDLINEFLQEKREEPFAIPASKKPTSIPIQLARDIKQSLSRRGSPEITRVALFYQMEKMKTSSADALLKLIEEPPSNTVIILTAQAPDRLLPTIQSRAQRIKLDRPAEDVAVAILTERYDISEKRARLVSRITQANVGQAMAMIEDADEGESSNRAVGFMLFKALFRESNVETVASVVDMIDANDQGAARTLIEFWQSLLRDCTYHASTGDSDSLVNIDFAAEIAKLSHFFDDPHLSYHMTDSFKNALADLYRNVHIQAALVALVLKLKSRIPVAGQPGR
jgi:DNA polymerase-3 subunit delta'